MQLKTRLKELWRRKWYRRSAILLIALFILFGPIPFNGLYRGRVVDAETGKPIAGAVVLVGWTYMTPNVAGGTTHCIDGMEMLTDENGEFSFWGIGGLYNALISETYVGVYKVGYPNFDALWFEYKNIEKEEIEEDWIEKRGKFIRYEWGKATVLLRKAKTYREFAWEGAPPDVHCGRKDKKPLVELDKAEAEYRRLGRIKYREYKRTKKLNK